jgi:ATP-dependent Clp protease, protease subunit
MSIVGINFNGPISHPATTKLRNAFCMVMNDRLPDGKRKFDEIYFFFNSVGGSVEDGIGLFGFLRSLPIPITTINVNLVASIAIVPFLAAKKRIALPHSTFHFHDFEWNYAAAHNLTRLEYLDHTQILDSGKTTALKILKENTSLTDEDFKHLRLMEVPLIESADFAKEKGIVQEIEYVTIPEDMNIFNVDY